MKKQLTAQDFHPHVPPRVQRRFKHAETRKTHSFFDYKSEVFAVKDNLIYKIKSPFTGNSLCGFENVMKKLVVDGHYITEISPVFEGEVLFPSLDNPEGFTVNQHAIDRIRERCPVFRNQSDERVEQFIKNSLAKSLVDGTIFETQVDKAKFFVRGQFVFVVRHGHVRTTIRTCKLHLLALEVAKTSNGVVPDFLVSNQTKKFMGV